jgi:hypothetical protein
MISRGDGGSQAGHDIDPKRQTDRIRELAANRTSIPMYRKPVGDETGVSPARSLERRIPLRRAGVGAREAHSRLSLRERKFFRGAKVDYGVLPAKRVI